MTRSALCALLLVLVGCAWAGEDSDSNSSYDGQVYIGAFVNPHKDGLVVTAVATNSAGERAGLQVGDVITSVDNKIYRNALSLQKEVTSRAIDSSLDVAIRRGDKQFNLPIRLDRYTQWSYRRDRKGTVADVEYRDQIGMLMAVGTCRAAPHILEPLPAEADPAAPQRRPAATRPVLKGEALPWGEPVSAARQQPVQPKIAAQTPKPLPPESETTVPASPAPKLVPWSVPEAVPESRTNRPIRTPAAVPEVGADEPGQASSSARPVASETAAAASGFPWLLLLLFACILTFLGHAVLRRQ